MRRLGTLAEQFGSDTVDHWMKAIQTRARDAFQQRIARATKGRFHAATQLDDGTPLAVCVDVGQATLSVDFEGAGATHPGNFNATPPIVRSAVLFVARLWVDDDLPLNEGFLDAIRIHIPHGLLNPTFPDDPARCPAVVAGNVETSQRIVELLVAALGFMASSQGTMNNVVFGDEHRSFYETLGGGAGAGPEFPGASAVHTHMTNTALTDPELLETRFPVRLVRLQIRRGSGGRGMFPGGDGMVRELAFLKPQSLAVLSQHREGGPLGAAGGEPGAPGRNTLVRADGTRTVLAAVAHAAVGAGDNLIVETPGGGGYGAV